jgi:Domain of unknown function (DUF4397)
MRKSTRNFVTAAAFLVILVAMGAGCSKTGSNITSTPVSYLSLINEAIYSSSLDVYLNDTLATAPAGIPAGNYSNTYGTIRPGNYTLKFAVVGSDSIVSQLSTSLFDTLNFYTVILYNNAGGGAVQSAKIQDNFSSISASNANYRFFNLSPNYPNVDLYLNTTVAQPGRTLADNVSNTVYNNFTSTSPGSYNVYIKKAGTDSVIASAANVALIGGNAYTIFLGGIIGSATTPLQVNVLQASY